LGQPSSLKGSTRSLLDNSREPTSYALLDNQRVIEHPIKREYVTQVETNQKSAPNQGWFLLIFFMLSCVFNVLVNRNLFLENFIENKIKFFQTYKNKEKH
jgi:hypothetical protein